jgi:hypothetical protein
MASKLKLTELLYPTSTTPAITINADDTVTFGAPTTTITNLSTTSITDSGNLTFTGTGNRIRGDFSNATIVNRVAFQSSTTNGQTLPVALPNGTSVTAGFVANSSSSDPANASEMVMAVVGASDVRFSSGIRGTGTYLPMTFLNGGSEAMRITTDRNVGIGTTNAAPANGKGMSINGGSITRIDLRTSTSGDASGDGTSLQLNGNDFTIENRETGFVAIATSLQERMRIDSSGNLLVGTNVTKLRLTVSGTTAAAPTLGTASGSALFANSDPAYGLMFGSSGGGQSWMQVQRTDGSATAYDLWVQPSGGNLLVGTTSASLSASNGIKFAPAGGGAGIPVMGLVGNSSVDAQGSYHLYSTASSSYRFYVGYGGTVFAVNTTISAISDQRLKENVREIDVGLDAIMSLKPRVFDWKKGKGKNTKNDRGFIAQEFEQVFPDLIDEWKDPAPSGEEAYKSVRQDLIPVLVKAIQEQQALIQDLTTRLNTLEGN